MENVRHHRGTATNRSQSLWTCGPEGYWSSPTIDPKRHALYATTGDAYTEPAAKTTDAIVAMDLDTGKIQWVVQGTEHDAWLAGCSAKNPTGNCPVNLGPDQDFSASPILKTLSNGHRILVAGQKSGNVWAYDPDQKGAVVWKTALTSNTTEFGGKIVWKAARPTIKPRIFWTWYRRHRGGPTQGKAKGNGSLRLEPAPAMSRHAGQDGPLTAIPGVVFFRRMGRRAARALQHRWARFVGVQHRP